MKRKINVTNKDELIQIAGERDSNIRSLEDMFNVRILYYSAGKGYTIEISGKNNDVEEAYTRLTANYLKRYKTPVEHDACFTTYKGKRIVPLTMTQKKYVNTINNNDIVVGIGPAGTGKTFMAVTAALTKLLSGAVNKIVLTRPVVESGERLGFLPGDLYEKINPYLIPLFDVFLILLGHEKFQQLRNDGIIEIIPLAYMRGRTLEDAFIVLDEAQNTVPEQMKMFLTRLGVNSQIVITGDITQIDLQKKHNSGLLQIKEILKNIDGIEFVYFNESDVVRHKLVKDIIKAYEKWEKTK